MRKDSDLCTVSDEACTMLILENNYDRWIDVHKNKTEGSTAIETAVALRADKRKHKWESDVAPRYTEGGLVYSVDRVMTQKGWKDKGIRRFNDLCHQVAKDRRDNPNVLTKMVREWKASVCIGQPLTSLRQSLLEQRLTMNCGRVRLFE